MRPRARDLGLPFPGTPGRFNAITDVAGVGVGVTTLIADAPTQVRTGVTAIVPRLDEPALRPVWAGSFALNGNGEMTGTHWIRDAGQFCGPVCITNTHSVGVVHHAAVRWMIQRHRDTFTERHLWAMPVVAETYDGVLNDINGQHVTEADALAALDTAAAGAVAEGNVGGGTGMICYEYKGGSGTASRVLDLGGASWRVGVLVQANFGKRRQLTVAGLPVGRWLEDGAPGLPDHGSIIAVIATDLPLLPHQLKRLARRAGLGIGRSGSIAAHGSGDIFLAFSTANAAFFAARDSGCAIEAWPDEGLNPVFEAVIQGVDEAVLNAMVANATMRGRDDHVVEALPHAPVEAWLRARPVRR